MTKILVLDRGDDLAEQIRKAAAGLPGRPEIVACSRTGSVEDLHDHEGPFAAIVAGPSLATRSGLHRLAQLHRRDPATAIVLTLKTRPDASLREIVQVGACDLVELPADEAALKAALTRALDIAGRVNRPAKHTAVHEEPKTTGRVISVASPTGGCGKTFFATNMAYHVARTSDAKVVLVDLDLQFGEVTTALRLAPHYTIADALAHDGDGAPDNIEEYLVSYDGLFSVLAAPKEPSQADRIAPLEVSRMIEALRSRFDYVIVDTPPALAETVLAALDISEHLFVLATHDLPSVRNLVLFLQTLQRLQIPAENMSLVLNKIEHDVGIGVDEIVKLFPQGFRAKLPYAREVSRSINLGKPVIATYPDAEISRGLVAGIRAFLPDTAAGPVSTSPVARPAPRRLSKLFRRKAAARPAIGGEVL